MKKHLVMICGFHYPYTSPTATCAERYISLFKNEYEIDIISCSENGEKYDFINEKGFHLHVLTCRRLELEYLAKGIVKKVIHIAGSALLYKSYLGNQKWYAKVVAEKLNNIHAERPIDLVFSICSPLAAHAGAQMFKKFHPEVKCVSYTVDPYSTQDRLKPICRSMQDMVYFERHILQSFDEVLLSEEVFDNRVDLREGLSNCHSLPYLLPELSKDSLNKPIYDATGVHCVYAGSFYKEIRNPEYMLRVFSLLSGKPIFLHLYSKGCENIVEKYSSFPNIVLHQLVKPDELRKIYGAADVLIGIGNSLSEFLPSKTFEYIATRKPIAYFNYSKMGNEVLKNYPQCCQFYMDSEINESASSLLEFCNQLNGKLVSEAQIFDAYSKYSPESIKRILTKVFQA